MLWLLCCARAWRALWHTMQGERWPVARPLLAQPDPHLCTARLQVQLEMPLCPVPCQACKVCWNLSRAWGHVTCAARSGSTSLCALACRLATGSAHTFCQTWPPACSLDDHQLPFEWDDDWEAGDDDSTAGGRRLQRYQVWSCCRATSEGVAFERSHCVAHARQLAKAV